MTFEESLPILNGMLELYRSRWTLKAVPYEDVEQKIRIHVFNKWHLYDQKKDLRPWLARLIQRQIKNVLRNEYYSYLPPCRKCPMFLGDEHCKMYKRLDRCALYNKYQKTKKTKENMKFAISYETIPYDTHQGFSCEVAPIIDGIYREVQGVDQQIFALFFESGFSVTKIAQTLQASGMALTKTFELVKMSLQRTRQIAQEVLEERKSVMGLAGV